MFLFIIFSGGFICFSVELYCLVHVEGNYKTEIPSDGTSMRLVAEWMASPLPQLGGHVCNNCGRSYKQKNALWRHFKYECGKAPRFQCPYCRYRTKQKSNMYTHIKHRHFGLKVYALDLEPNS